jgi:hypothetical protein
LRDQKEKKQTNLEISCETLSFLLFHQRVLSSRATILNTFSPFLFEQGMRMTGENTETLHLTMLERESGGSYACAAKNTEGETRSSSLYLKVQCK